MKLKLKIVAGAAVLLFLTFAVSLRAQLTNILSITATASMQGNPSDNGTVNTTASVKLKVDTKQILAWLAQDEFAEGNFNSNSFPSGARLVYVVGIDVDRFQVIDKENNFLADVSDIISFSGGDNDIFSGRQNDVTGLPDTTMTDTYLLRFNYDDSGVSTGSGPAVGLTFFLEGLNTTTIIDTVPKAGTYKETTSSKVTDATGEGTYQSNPFVISGSLSSSGKGTVTIAPSNVGSPGGSGGFILN